MLKDNWKDKQNGVDEILAEDINSIANAVVEGEEEIEKLKKSNIVDQTFDRNSENAQSGKAVAEALAGVGGEKPWRVIEDITLTEAVNPIYFDVEKLRTYKELHIEAYIVPTDTTVTSQVVQFNDGAPLFQVNVNCKSTGKIYIILDVYQSPQKATILDGTISVYDYALSGGTMKVTRMTNGVPQINTDGLYFNSFFSLRFNGANTMAEGTCVKVWGR